MTRLCLCFGLMLGLFGATDAVATEAPEIVVTAPMLQVLPERSLDGAELQSYGLTTVGELVAEIAAEDGESSDDIAFLVNGRRVAGLGSAASLPAEAVVKIDVLPAGSGIALGASARQRVYNISLTRKLDLAAASAAARLPTSGGWSALRGDFTFSHIRGERRITLAAKARDEAMLLESERGVFQPAGSPADAGRLRSLVPAASGAEFSLAAADELNSWLSASFSSNLSISDKHALLGPAYAPAFAGEALEQGRRAEFASADLTLDARLGPWQLGLFGNFAYQHSRISTDRQISSGEASTGVTRSATRSLAVRTSAIGPLLSLPAGPITLSLEAGATRDSIAGATGIRGSLLRSETAVSTSTLSVALDIPIASRASGALPWLGDLSASIELSRQHASDFGSFSNHSLSLLWRPFSWLSLTGSVTRSDTAPPVASLDEPILATPRVRYFDPLRGETVDVTWISGGTPSLKRQSDETRRLLANLKPFRSLGLRLSAEYFEIRNRNLVSDLPMASLSVFEAFPERFVRDADGGLAVVDARPVSFPNRSEQQLRTGLILSLPLGQRRSGRLAGDEDEEANALRANRAHASVRPRLQLSVSHSWLLSSKLTIRAGQRPIDLLSRRAIGFGGLGQPRHRIDASLGYAERGAGVRAGMQWRSESLVEASGSTVNFLRFHPLATFGLRAWVQGERLAPRSPWMTGTRLTISIVNATNVRERVDDRLGFTPLAYQPAYRDPIGRSFEIQLRKRF